MGTEKREGYREGKKKKRDRTSMRWFSQGNLSSAHPMPVEQGKRKGGREKKRGYQIQMRSAMVLHLLYVLAQGGYKRKGGGKGGGRCPKEKKGKKRRTRNGAVFEACTRLKWEGKKR